MSAGRFKSKDDYFSRRSGLAEQVIAAKPQPQPQPQQPPSSKQAKRRGVENAVPSPLLRVHFCKTVERFEITGKGKFHKGEYPLDDALQSHLDGETTLLVSPLSPSGETAFTVVRFDLSEEMDHPFSKARQYADELQKYGIPGLIEVTEGGKGHYHLWLFHEQPVPAAPFSEALVRLGRRLFGLALETVPPVSGDASIPLPLQGESVLLQRRVFVNAVGKMIKEQGSVLQSIEYCPKRVSDGFIARMSEMPKPLPSTRPAVPVVERAPLPSVEKPKPATAAPSAVPPLAPKPVPAAPPKAVAPSPVPAVEVPKPVAPSKSAPPAPEPVSPEALSSPVTSDVLSTPPEVPEDVTEPVSVPSASAVDDTGVESGDQVPADSESGALSVNEALAPSAETLVLNTTDAETPSDTADPVKAEPAPISPEPPVTSVPVATEPVPAPQPLPVFVFQRGGVEYGIAVERVASVAAAGGISSLPGAERGVRGTLARGGRTVTVLDPGALSGGGMSPVSPKDRVVLVKTSTGEIGLLADGVSGMASLPPERIAPLAGDERFRVASEPSDSGRSILLPDVDRLLAPDDGKPERTAGKALMAAAAEPHVLFSGGGGQFALPSRSVREILPDITAERGRGPAGGLAVKTVPYRGGELRVVDILAAVSSSGDRAVTADVRKSGARGRILVLRAENALFGVRVDAITGIRALPSGEIEPVGGNAAPVTAMVRLTGSEGVVRVLDPERMGKLGTQFA